MKQFFFHHSKIVLEAASSSIGSMYCSLHAAHDQHGALVHGLPYSSGTLITLVDSSVNTVPSPLSPRPRPFYLPPFFLLFAAFAWRTRLLTGSTLGYVSIHVQLLPPVSLAPLVRCSCLYMIVRLYVMYIS